MYHKKQIIELVSKKIKRMRVSLIKMLVHYGAAPISLTETQQAFIEWNSQRLNISMEDSKDRYMESWKALYGGHEGDAFKLFGSISDKLHKIFVDSTDEEIFEVYRFHSLRHFLRMLSYQDPIWKENDPLLKTTAR